MVEFKKKNIIKDSHCQSQSVQKPLNCVTTCLFYAEYFRGPHSGPFKEINGARESKASLPECETFYSAALEEQETAGRNRNKHHN